MDILGIERRDREERGHKEGEREGGREGEGREREGWKESLLWFLPRAKPDDRTPVQVAYLGGDLGHWGGTGKSCG